MAARTTARSVRCTRGVARVLLLPDSLESAGNARVFVADVLCPQHGTDALATVQLVASELVTEALLHGAPPYELTVACHVHEIRVAVTDRSVTDREPMDDDDALRRELLEKVTREVGVDTTPTGRSRWCTVPTGFIPSQPSGPRLP